MKIITWNVNGLRSVMGKNKAGEKIIIDKNNKDILTVNVLESIIKEQNPDIIALQETKCPADTRHALEIYFSYHKIVPANKKGYSGVAVFSKEKPILELTDFLHNEEGRCIVLEFDKFFFMNTYTPNSKRELERLDYRVNTWEPYVRMYINALRVKKPIIFVSDFNCAPTELDIYKVKGHEKSASFTKEEREAFNKLLQECSLTNAFRYMYPNERKYTWFSNFANSRERNAGWTIDHALVSTCLAEKINKVEVLYDYRGSDHCPLLLEISL